MPNSHDNTKQMRMALRTHERIKLGAARAGLTASNWLDRTVETRLRQEHATDILEATEETTPEPRRSVRPRSGA